MKFTAGSSKLVANFLSQEPDFPIVAHNVEFDRDKVLRPAFERVGHPDLIAKDGRWRCTCKLAERLPNLESRKLDDVLEECGFERRKKDAIHDAVIDAELAAKVYMYLIKLPEVEDQGHAF